MCGIVVEIARKYTSPNNIDKRRAFTVPTWKAQRFVFFFFLVRSRFFAG
jgi:hypothetical protein